MRQLALVPLLLTAALSACSSAPPDVSGMSPEQACAVLAENDKDVKTLNMIIMTHSSGDKDLRPDLKLARKKAIDSCLAARGIFAPGGVEPIQPR